MIAIPLNDACQIMSDVRRLVPLKAVADLQIALCWWLCFADLGGFPAAGSAKPRSFSPKTRWQGYSLLRMKEKKNWTRSMARRKKASPPFIQCPTNQSNRKPTL